MREYSRAHRSKQTDSHSEAPEYFGLTDLFESQLITEQYEQQDGIFPRTAENEVFVPSEADLVNFFVKLCHDYLENKKPYIPSWNRFFVQLHADSKRLQHFPSGEDSPSGGLRTFIPIYDKLNDKHPQLAIMLELVFIRRKLTMDSDSSLQEIRMKVVQAAKKIKEANYDLTILYRETTNLLQFVYDKKRELEQYSIAHNADKKYVKNTREKLMAVIDKILATGNAATIQPMVFMTVVNRFYEDANNMLKFFNFYIRHAKDHKAEWVAQARILAKLLEDFNTLFNNAKTDNNIINIDDSITLNPELIIAIHEYKKAMDFAIKNMEHISKSKSKHSELYKRLKIYTEQVDERFCKREFEKTLNSEGLLSSDDIRFSFGVCLASQNINDISKFNSEMAFIKDLPYYAELKQNSPNVLVLAELAYANQELKRFTNGNNQNLKFITALQNETYDKIKNANDNKEIYNITCGLLQKIRIDVGEIKRRNNNQKMPIRDKKLLICLNEIQERLKGTQNTSFQGKIDFINEMDAFYNHAEKMLEYFSNYIISNIRHHKPEWIEQAKQVEQQLITFTEMFQQAQKSETIITPNAEGEISFNRSLVLAAQECERSMELAKKNMLCVSPTKAHHSKLFAKLNKSQQQIKQHLLNKGYQNQLTTEEIYQCIAHDLWNFSCIEGRAIQAIIRAVNIEVKFTAKQKLECLFEQIAIYCAGESNVSIDFLAKINTRIAMLKELPVWKNLCESHPNFLLMTELVHAKYVFKKHPMSATIANLAVAQGFLADPETEAQLIQGRCNEDARYIKILSNDNKSYQRRVNELTSKSQSYYIKEREAYRHKIQENEYEIKCFNNNSEQRRARLERLTNLQQQYQGVAFKTVTYQQTCQLLQKIGIAMLTADAATLRHLKDVRARLIATQNAETKPHIDNVLAANYYYTQVCKMEKYLQKYLNGTHKSEWIENAEKVLAQLHDYKTKYESNDVIIFEDGELKKNKIIDDAIDAYEQSEATAMMQMLNTNKSYKKAHHSKLFKQLNNYVHKSKDINKRARVEIVDFVQHMIKQINRKQHSFFVTPRPGDYQLISQLQTFATNIEKPTVDVKKAFNSMKNVSICKAEIYKRYINQLNTKIDLAFSDIEAQVAVPPVA